MTRATCLALILAFSPLIAQEKPAEPIKPAAVVAPAPKPPAGKAAAAPAALPAKPATAPDNSGTGVFFEGYGIFVLAIAAQTSTGSTYGLPDGTVSATSTTYKSPNTMGFGGGGALGYNIVNNLALMLSFDYRYLKSRKYNTTASSVSTDRQNKYATSWVGLGLRPRLVLGGGALYAGAGVAFLLPHNDITTATNSATGSTSTTETEYNYTIGAYGEMGYQLEISEGIYLGLGTRLFIAGPSNKGGVSETGTVQISNVETVTKTDGTEAIFSTKNITDVSFTLSLGLRL